MPSRAVACVLSGATLGVLACLPASWGREFHGILTTGKSSHAATAGVPILSMLAETGRGTAGPRFSNLDEFE